MQYWKTKKTKSIKTPEKNSIKKLFSCCCLKQAFYGLSAMTSFVLAMLSFRIFMNLHIYRWNRKAQHLLRARVWVASKASLHYALCKVSNFTFEVCKLTCVIFIAEDMTRCIKILNCDILYQFHSWPLLFLTGSVYYLCGYTQTNAVSHAWHQKGFAAWQY